MSLVGGAFIALWNDIEREREGEYHDWHTREHVPQRVGIPGILSGRRYFAENREEHRHFTLYDVRSLAVLEGTEYLAVVNGPTPWTLSMRPAFRNVLRYPCRTTLSLGQGVGGALATLRFTGDAAPSAALEAGLAAILEMDGVTALHLGAVEAPANPFPLFGGGGRAEGGEQLLVIEGLGPDALDAAVPAAVARLADVLDARATATAIYRLVFLTGHTAPNAEDPS